MSKPTIYKRLEALQEQIDALKEAGSGGSGDGSWDVFPIQTPIAVYGVTFGGSDGRRCIMPGETEVRENWVVCDGAETDGVSVPNLQGRFILGASSDYAEAATGGNTSVTTNVTGSISNASTTISSSTMPSHTHSHSFPSNVTGVVGYHSSNKSGSSSAPIVEKTTSSDISSPYYNDSTSNYTNSNTGSGSSHSHANTISISNGSINILNPYCALWWVMRIA